MSEDNMFQISPSGHLQFHMHKCIKEKLKHVHDISFWIMPMTLIYWEEAYKL